MFSIGNHSIMMLDNLDVPYTNNHVFLRATFSSNFQLVDGFSCLLRAHNYILHMQMPLYSKSKCKMYALNEKR